MHCYASMHRRKSAPAMLALDDVSVITLLLGNERAMPTMSCRGRTSGVLVSRGLDLWLTGKLEPFLYTENSFSTL